MDWFDCMGQYEELHDGNGGYGIDSSTRGRIVLWRLPDYETVGKFTFKQAEKFFMGLVNKHDIRDSISYDAIRENIQVFEEMLYEAAPDMHVEEDGMTNWERYCYLSEWVKEL